VAFYPTKVPLHYRSKFLGDGDTFGEMLAGCRKLGMVVTARVDPHAAHQDVFDAHPDWIAVEANGQPAAIGRCPRMGNLRARPLQLRVHDQRHPGDHDLYKVDGVFANRWSGSGMCYCRHCQRNFKEFSGLELPREAGRPPTPALNTPPGRKNAFWSCTPFGMPRSGSATRSRVLPNGFDQIRDNVSVPILFADRQSRSGFQLPWQNGRNAKEARATNGSKPIVGICSVGFEDPYRWKDSTQNPHEIRLWAVDGIAQGFRPWVVKFNAKPLDHRWFKPVEDLYVWHWKNEKYLRNERPLARVGLVSAERPRRTTRPGSTTPWWRPGSPLK